MMRRKKLEHLVTTGMIEGKHSWDKQQKKMFYGLTKWLNGGQVAYLLHQGLEMYERSQYPTLMSTAQDWLNKGL